MNPVIFQCDQGTPEWFECRMGIPTASMFATVMAEGRKKGDPSKTRNEYMRKLAGEVLTGEPMENYTNHHFERGHAMEDDARQAYCRLTNTETTRVGFIRNGQKGASPDSLIGNDGGLEIKTALPHIQIDRLLRDTLPSEHRHQVQGCIWIAGREWWDFCSFWPTLPLFKVRVYRDDGFIAQMAGAINQFNDELAEMIEKIRRYGTMEKAA